jgi:hypothetical protein
MVSFEWLASTEKQEREWLQNGIPNQILLRLHDMEGYDYSCVQSAST